MMGALIRRGEKIARAAQRARVLAVADTLKAVLGAGAVEVEDARLVVRGRHIVRRWLIDPALRFLK